MKDVYIALGKRYTEAVMKDDIPASSQAVSASDTNSHDLPRVLLLGNGINRMTDGNQSWDDMMAELETPIVDFLDPTENFKSTGKLISDKLGMSLFRVQRAVNYQYGDKEAEQKAIEKWAAKLEKVSRNGIHAYLASEKELFQAILTTNYDHLLEKALGIDYSKIAPMDASVGNLFRKLTHEQTGVSVYHIHGEVGETPSMLYSVSHYLEEIVRIVNFCRKRQNKEYLTRFPENPTWLDYLVHSELHICGLGFNFDELVLWYALQKRLERYGYGMLGAYVYLTYTPKEKASVKARASVFESYGVRPVCVPVHPDSGYKGAWQQIIGAMLLNIKRLKADQKSKKKRPPTAAELAKLDEEKRKKLEQAMLDFSLKRHGMNICSCNTVAYWNTERCIFRIPSGKLDKAVAAKADWYFDILINTYRATYVIPAKKLKELIDAMGRTLSKDKRYSISVDFRTGAIYAHSEEHPDRREGMKRLKKLPLSKIKPL